MFSISALSTQSLESQSENRLSLQKHQLVKSFLVPLGLFRALYLQKRHLSPLGDWLQTFARANLMNQYLEERSKALVNRNEKNIQLVHNANWCNLQILIACCINSKIYFKQNNCTDIFLRFAGCALHRRVSKWTKTQIKHWLMETSLMKNNW